MKTNNLRFVEEDRNLSVSQRKKNLRFRMKERRGENENRDIKETLLVENFKKEFLDKTTGAGTSLTYFIYLSFSSEAPTDKLIELLLNEGNKVCCPRVEGKEMQAVEFSEDLTLSDYGIREPVGKEYEGEIDVLIIPLLAVDEQGNRLGYGGGFYDRFIKKHPKALKVGYCYDFQIVGKVPTEDTDERLQCVVTDKRVLHFN